MTFTPARSDAIRAGLIQVAAARRPLKLRRVLVGVSLIVAGMLVGGTATAFAATNGWVPFINTPSGQPTPVLASPVDAPSGLIPGEPIISMLGDLISQRITKETEISFTDRPQAATHARVTITCLTEGTIFWGTDPGGSNPSLVCSKVDKSSMAWTDFPLDDSVTTLYVTPSNQAEASVTIQFLTYLPTKFGINKNGQTYGTGSYGPSIPDLVAVIGEAPDGSAVLGYARAIELWAYSPDLQGEPKSPEEALQWQQEREAKYPDGWDVPVFESDGTTQIGAFHVG